MRKTTGSIAAGLLLLCLFVLCPVATLAAGRPVPITVGYPEQGSVFPPDFAAPTFLWRDAAEAARFWRVEITFGDGSKRIRMDCTGERLRAGEVDERAVAETNRPPQLTPEQAASRTWQPDAATWAAIKRGSVKRPATVTITGYSDEKKRRMVSRGAVMLRTSPDPVDAPIFYRDVPLMPSELEKGVIKPLAAAAIPLINWRLRDVGQPDSRILMTGLHTCANCHSFSRDGKTMGMDLDGPQNDKGMYAIVPVAQRMTIRNEDVVNWGSFRGALGPDLRVGFMSQVSPDGRHVVTMIDRPDAAGSSRQPQARAGRGHFYVANFKDYRFLQVFYPTRGILAWYDRAAKRLQPLPGADDPRYVHTNAVWTPDGRYLVFARASAREPYPEGIKLAEYANDPSETAIQYDLYRIPFNEGQGGSPEAIAGASANGMSNTFPKVSPDGRWIVFVQCKNGQLMRPDSQLYIVPAAGGRARRMRCNTPLMNSWHSFSPNGRWMVFSSKSRSPYTQMYLTHIDEEGNDSPAILVENSTAANRAVNIPEFVNVPLDGMMQIDVPAVEYYRQFDVALDLSKKGRFEEAAAEWGKARELVSDDPRVHTNLGAVLAKLGRVDEAIESYEQALRLSPLDAEAHMNFGMALAGNGKLEEAVSHYRQALESKPESAETHSNLGAALAAMGKLDEAIAEYGKALEINPQYPEVHNNLGVALARSGRNEEAVAHFEKALQVQPDSAGAHNNLGRTLARMGRIDDAIAHFERAVASNPQFTVARQNLGEMLYVQGKTAEALDQWREVLRAEPNHVLVLNAAARALATSPLDTVRNGAEAVALAERAVQLTGGREPVVLDTLAAAYAEAGRFPDAMEAARRALALATQANIPPLVEALKSRIALYEAGTSLRVQ